MEYHPKAERLQLTEHDVLGINRYNAGLEEVSLDAERIRDAQASFTPVDASTEPVLPRPETRTDKVLLILFGITTADLHGLGKILIVCASVSVAILIGLIIHIIFGPPQIEPHGAVATDEPACSAMGLDVLKAGGSAVDAAIAALFCLGVVSPQSAGIGGGGFALIYDHKTKASYYVDFRETTPAEFKAEMMEDIKKKRALSIGVPGELRGLDDIHSVFGKRKWRDLILPAAKLAREGFPVTKALVNDLWRFDEIKDLPSSERLKKFLYPNGVALKEGEIVKRRNYALTLEKIAYNGAEEFYTGQTSKDILQEIEKHNGVLSAIDLVGYNVSVKEPVSTTFNGFRVLTAPPPSSGAAFLLALNMMEGYNFTKNDVNSPLFWHRFIEVSKFAYANMARLGDAKFEPVVDMLCKNMTSKAYADSLRGQIVDSSTLSSYGVSVSQPDLFGTTHISVVDNNELYVAITSTINNYFGSGIMTESGVILNDQMADFASPADAAFEQANVPVPGKRPLSSMIPTIAYHPTRQCINRIVVGGSNGSRIPDGVLNCFLNLLLFGMNVTDALEYPRVFADKPKKPVEIESLLTQKMESLVKTLEGFGHKVEVVTDGLSVVQAVMKNNKTITAHSDSRKQGAAAIY